MMAALAVLSFCLFLFFLAYISRGFNYGFNAKLPTSTMQVTEKSKEFLKPKEEKPSFHFKTIPFAIKTYFNGSDSKLSYEVVSSIYNSNQKSVTLTLNLTNKADALQIPILNLQFFDSEFNLIKDYDIADPNVLLEAGQSKMVTFIVSNVLLKPNKLYVFFRNNVE